MKKAVFLPFGIFFAVVLAIIFVATRTAGFQRHIKSLGSDFSGGLNRTVTVYDYNGNEIKSWSGKIDISESENEVFFDLNDKRIIIHGGIVITEEN